MANSNPYLILRRVRDSVIRNIRDLFRPENNTAVTPTFQYKYLESSSTGTIRFVGNPTNLNTILINGITVTFVTGAPVGNQVHIGIAQIITQANFIAFVNAHSSTLNVTATQSPINNVVDLKATVSSLSGNAITLVTNIPTVIQVSGPTLTGGGLWDFDNSEIFIGDVIPQDYQDWPMIVVDTASANETRYLGPEDLGWTKNPFGVVTQDKIFSSLVVNVNINLYTIDDTIARDEIIDLIYNNISEIRDDLATHGIEMIDRTLPTETRVYQDGRWYVTNHFVLRVYCEWTDSLDITNVTDIDPSITVDTEQLPKITSPISASGPNKVLFNIISNLDSTHLRVDSTNNIVVGDKLVQGIHTTPITTVGLSFTVTTVSDGTHLIVNNTINMTAGDTISQGAFSTTITTVTDGTHLVVGNTTGWIGGASSAIDNNVLIVGSTTGFVVGSVTALILPFIYLITAINQPISYGAIGLPSGLSVDSGNGLISGVPVTSGIFYITLSATNVIGTGTSPLTLTVDLSQ